MKPTVGRSITSLLKAAVISRSVGITCGSSNTLRKVCLPSRFLQQSYEPEIFAGKIYLLFDLIIRFDLEIEVHELGNGIHFLFGSHVRVLPVVYRVGHIPNNTALSSF